MNRPTSRRENDTIEEVAKQRDLDNLMQAQEDFKQRDLQKDIDMMAEKHPEFMQQMMGQEQQQGMDQQMMAQGVPPEQLMQMQAPQSVQPMGMPQGMPMDPNQIPPEMLAQMPEAQQGMPVMAYGGHMYMCGGKMYNFGGKMYANGGHMYADGGQILRGIGAGAYGAGEGLLDTLTFGLTDTLTDKGFTALSNIGDRTPEELERERMIKGFGNTAGAITGGILSGGSALGSAISEGSEGLGEGVTNIAGTGEKFDNIANTIASIGSMAGSFIGNPADAATNATAKTGDAMSKVPKFAEKIMGAAKNENLQKIPGVLDAVSGVVGQGIQSNQMMNQMQQQQMMNQPRMVTGYNMSPTPMQMKYGGYTAQAPWHNFPQYTPNYPGNAGPMYMGLGTNLFAAGGMMGGIPGPGDGVTTTTPVMMDNPAYDLQMAQYMATLPYKTNYKGYTEQGASGRDAVYTRLATQQELENLNKRKQAEFQSQLKEIGLQKQYGNISDEAYNNFMQGLNFYPTKLYTRPIPEGQPENYYEDPNNLTDYWAGSYPMPSKQIEDPFAIIPTITPEPKKELQYVNTNAVTAGGDQRAIDWGIDSNTGQPTPMYKLFNPDVPSQAQTQVQFSMPRGKNYGEVQENLYNEYNTRLQKAMGNFGAEVLGAQDPNYSSNYYIDNPQLLQEGYNKYINDPEWINSLSAKDKARYVVPDYSNIPLYANQAGEEMYVPLKTGENTWRYKGEEFNYDPTLPQTTVSRKTGGYINRNNTMYSPDLTYAAKMGGQLYNYGGGLKSPLMPLPVGNFVKYADGGKIVEGTGNDPYQYKTENGKYYAAKKGSTAWTEVSPTNTAAVNTIKNLIVAKYPNYPYETGFEETMMANINAEQNGELVPPTIEEAEANQALAIAQEAMQNAETSEEYLAASAEYQSVLQKLQEKLKDANIDLSMNQGLLSGAAMAVPAAYNLGAGIFGKAEQLDPREYMIPEDITPYEYNINPQLAAANQTYAQAQEAFRNASMSGGDYMANMQQLANARNTDIGELYTNKQNLDAAQVQAAKTANKEIQTANLERKMGIEDFNRLSKAAKQGLLQTGLTQLADIGKNAESKKLDLAYIKAVAPDFADNLSYSALGEQFLKFLQNQKESSTTNKP
jgi:hypothetical protein